MKSLLLQFKLRRLRATKLTADEFNVGKQQLVSLLRERPMVRMEFDDRHTQQRSPMNQLFPLLSLRPMYIALVLALAVTVATGGGAAIAAEQSLPGDVLYTVKLNVNEPVKAALTFDAKARANVEAKRAERRLEEAEKISAEARAELEPEVRAEISTNFKRFADQTRERIAAVDVEGDTHGAAELSVNFATALRAHDAVLARLSAEATASSTQKIELDDLRDDVKETTLAVSADLKAAAEGRQKAVENKIAEVVKFIVEVKQQTNADARLAAARAALAAGTAKLKAAAYAEAIVEFNKAFDLAQEAKTDVKAKVRVDTDGLIKLKINP